MNTQLFQGQHVRLETLKSDADAEVMRRWTSSAASWRLLGLTDVRSPAPDGERVEFLIYRLDANRPIGHAGLFGIGPLEREAWLSIGMGERDLWTQRVSIDALKVVPRYGFNDLNLNRILVGVFEYNARALLAYEAAGFVIEGRILQEAGRAGQSRAGVCMSLRRDEWVARSET